jgi:hypothetical protein
MAATKKKGKRKGLSGLCDLRTLAKHWTGQEESKQIQANS